MKSIRRLLPVLLCAISLANAQPQLSVQIHIPAITVDPGGEAYSPMPLPVQVTIHNTGNAASGQLSARISFTPDLLLDASEAGAIIKVPVPSAVPAHDSSRVDWLLVHPPSFAAKNYRIRVWLVTSPVDSFETQKLFTLPAMSPPDFKFTMGPVPRLEVRTDSLGYVINPFTLALRLANQGGTSIDSVSTLLVLPPDYILEPVTQANPFRVPIPMPPPTGGNPRIDISWIIRYYGATIQSRTDTLRIVAKGKDIAGNLFEEDTLILLQVDGLSPIIDLGLQGPNSLQYDPVTIYTPQPCKLTARIENIGEQWAQILSAKITLNGEGITLLDPAVRPILLSLLPGTVVNYQWDIAVERRAAARQFTATVETVDLDGRRRSTSMLVMVPGKQYQLMVEGLTAPDTLALNAAGTDFITPIIPVRYVIANRTWYNSTVQYVKVQSQGTGIVAPPFHEHPTSVALAPIQSSPEMLDEFEVEGGLKGRVVNFHVLAYSDRGDTARGTRPVFVPGLRPVLSMHRWGADELVYDRVNGYAPNPFYEEYVLRNDGYVAVRVDSLRIAFDSDGVATPDPHLRNIGWMLNPGDTLLTRWNFQAYKRSTDRDVRMSVSAWTSGEQHLTLDHTVRVPGLYPIPELTSGGDDTLAYDPVNKYAPNPFTRTLRIRNIGTDDLRCDSIGITFSDPLVTLLDAPVWNAGTTLAPDSAIELSWRFSAQERATSVELPITVTLHHSGGGTRQATGTVFIPALLPGLDVSFSGDSFLTMDAATVYAPDPFTKTVRVANNGTGVLRLDSIRLKSIDPDIRYDGARTQYVQQELQPGQSASASWHGRSGPRYINGNVLLEFDVHHSGGAVLPVATAISIPGMANSFEVTDIDIPAKLDLDASGYEYEQEGFAVRFRALNNCWSRNLFTRAVVEPGSVDGVTHVASTGEHFPNEMIDANSASGVVVDSFVVSPRTRERFVSIDITVHDGFLRTGTAKASIYIPAALATDVENLPTHRDFRIAAVYPFPVHRTADASVTVAVEGVRDGILRIEVLDLLGRTAGAIERSGETDNVLVNLPLRALAGGTYLLRALNGGRQQTRLLQVR